jgi:hypothetical protein
MTKNEIADGLRFFKKHKDRIHSLIYDTRREYIGPPKREHTRHPRYWTGGNWDGFIMNYRDLLEVADVRQNPKH